MVSKSSILFNGVGVPYVMFATQHKVTVVYATSGAVADRIRNGETADVLITSRSGIESMLKTERHYIKPVPRIALSRIAYDPVSTITATPTHRTIRANQSLIDSVAVSQKSVSIGVPQQISDDSPAQRDP